MCQHRLPRRQLRDRDEPFVLSKKLSRIRGTGANWRAAASPSELSWQSAPDISPYWHSAKFHKRELKQKFDDLEACSYQVAGRGKDGIRQGVDKPAFLTREAACVESFKLTTAQVRKVGLLSLN